MGTVLAETFAKMYGLPCWGVKPGAFLPMLTLEFGEPHLEIHEPGKTRWFPRYRVHMATRLVVIHGQWHLWIYDCDWSLYIGQRRVGCGSSPQNVQKAAEVLGGQALVSADVQVRGCRTILEFDLGARLETRPCNPKGEQWLLFTPTGNVLTLRADKKYTYSPGDGSEEKLWLPLLGLLD